MKSLFFNSIRTLIISALVLLGAGFLYAAPQTAPPGNAPAGNPPTFLNDSATAQAKVGWLSLGSLISPLAPPFALPPTAPLEVFNQGITDSLSVFGNGIIENDLTIGNVSNTAVELEVGGKILVTNLADPIGVREVCADDDGKLVICGGILPECSDLQNNDTDNDIDADDNGCWTDPTDPTTYDPLDNSEYYVPAPPPTQTPTAPSACDLIQSGGNSIHYTINCFQLAEETNGTPIYDYEVQVFQPNLNFDSNGNYAPGSNSWNLFGEVTTPYSNKLVFSTLTSNNTDFTCSGVPGGNCPLQTEPYITNLSPYAVAFRVRGIGAGQVAGDWSDVIVAWDFTSGTNEWTSTVTNIYHVGDTLYWDIPPADNANDPFFNVLVSNYVNNNYQTQLFVGGPTTSYNTGQTLVAGDTFSILTVSPLYQATNYPDWRTTDLNAPSWDGLGTIYTVPF